jgi:all-trans-retinol dehydrogenase (NAD+)
VEVDVTDVDAVGQAASRVEESVGAVHILVNNAGIITSKATLAEANEEEIRRTFEVNALALFWVTKAFLPGMVARDEGHIVTIGSASGMIGVARLVAYSASKHAAIGFDESLRMELAELAPGVRTTIVNPYYIDTGMFEGVRTKLPWLLPILKEHDVADAVVEAVARNRSRVIMPPAVKLLPIMHALPVALFDRAADLLGVNDTMRTFTGRR